MEGSADITDEDAGLIVEFLDANNPNIDPVQVKCELQPYDNVVFGPLSSGLLIGYS